MLCVAILTFVLASFNNIDYYYEEDLEMLKSSKDKVQYSGMGLTLMFLLFNPVVGVLFLKILQICEIYRFINVQLPANVLVVLGYFDFNLVKVIPNIFHYDETKSTCFVHQKVKENEKHCLFMNNGGISLLIQMIGYTCLKGIAVWIRSRSNSRKGNLFKLANYLNRQLNARFMFATLSAIQLEFLPPILINMRHFFFYPVILVINSTISLALLLSYFYFCFMCFRASYLIRKHIQGKGSLNGLKKSLKRWRFLFSSLKEKVKGIGRHFASILLFKDFVICAAVLLFLDLPVVQISICLVYNAVVMWLIIWWRPLKKTAPNLILFFNLLSEIGTLLIFAALIWFKDSTDEFKYKYIGNGMIFFLIVILIIDVIIGIFGTICSAIELVKWAMAMKKKINTTKNSVKPKVSSKN